MAIEVGEVFTLVDEEEMEQEVEVLGALTIEEQNYIAVAYLDELEEESAEEDVDVFFLRVADNDELSAIESDEEFEKVSAAFDEAMEPE
ncbi:DUF1292 domain-containing protein [Paenibacillus cremeus]|uniref:DUF1292 domain-containing protein n=1 Tax=Paenibacillus cremeus TaxID=2163881 RepID=A0A559K9G2_9BACL|nr:DUF1292 domain-containing protein [Paenibacillus cremeus]TVY08767.1 DUF1292 domain-containing protein [Paenibacillus cremeus]